MNKFDYIIVGAGSAGCVLARRLSDQKNLRVLLIEAGGKNRHPFVSLPRGFHRLGKNPNYFWNYLAAEKDDGSNETWRYGKGLGGSSSVNGMWYMRGMPHDFDYWEKVAGTNWNWNSIERTYKLIESYKEDGAHISRGQKGPLQITQSSYRSPVTAAALSAGKELGLKVLSDINEPNTNGIGYSQFTIDRSGRRGSSYRVFLEPVKSRRNLVVMYDTEVKRIIINDGRATGVLCINNNIEYTYESRCEVIICAGVIQSPKLLQLSGIGPANVIQQANLRLMHLLDTVGKNLFDHPMTKIVYELNNDKNIYQETSSYKKYLNIIKYYAYLKGFMATSSVPITAMISNKASEAWPNIQLGMIPMLIGSDKFVDASAKIRHAPRPGIMFMGFELRPRCRGDINIVSSDYRAAPSIFINWKDNKEDREEQNDITRIIRRLARSRSLSSFCGEELSAVSEKQSTGDPLTSSVFESGSHGGGTCRMGYQQTESVVGPNLLVHGLKNLRVADASVMPSPVSGNTNAIVMVIGWKAADLILDQQI
ncbi:GMC family oxidoreductase [Paracoccus sp. JM45]|uniref:GMC family oxidoreductase n=1 Tax=Paracoccus sp. JM45 TaxID=2283626 RepID=UPI000E6D09A0|nr:GMC family oxidoreductase [Paracoccus sp. JM45]RJE78526.1 GMC family oxidoreductase [Paracoccus sp. JM45]